MAPVIEARGLHKTFREKRSLRRIAVDPFGRGKPIEALRGVDLHVDPGEIVSLLGPNGAGKTTLLKIITCLVLPDRGEARVLGIDTRHESRVKPSIGLVQTDERSFYWRLTARQNLRFFARLYDVPRSRTEARIAELLERLDLTDAADRPFSTYSAGMKQRVAILRALLHDPPVLVMDEPTRSLDPAASLSLRRLVLDELRGRDGKTILIATHDLSEAAAMSDRVVLMGEGRVLLSGTVDEVRRWGVDTWVYELVLEGAAALPDGPFDWVADDGGTPRKVQASLREGASVNDLLRALLDAGFRIESCRPQEPDLEEAFERIVGAS